jgi:uncharacterized protein
MSMQFFRRVAGGLRRQLTALLPGFMLTSFVTGCVTGLTLPAHAQVSAVETAQRVADDLIADRAAAVAARFTPQVAAKLSERQLQDLWSSIVARSGPVQSTSAPRIDGAAGGVTYMTVPVAFQRGALDLRVALTAEGKIAGLFFRPAAVPPWSPPAYADRASFTDVEVEVGAAPWLLGGTLSLPRTASRTSTASETSPADKTPAVVLVHGSGPSDRNEQIGPNRPFQDLAEGLASRGIAVLRYEKRTKVYGPQFSTLATATVREETVDDALAAIALLRSRPEIDAGRIVVAGHSLGAMMAPMIAAERPDLAGIVMLAGVSRPLPPLMVEQFRYLEALDGPPDEAAKARIAAMEAEAAKAMAVRPGDAGNARILGAFPAYWADFNRYDVAAAAQKLTMPILLLHGARDYQVTARDHAALVSALAAKPNVTAEEFPALNHLFMAGEGPSRPEEYQRAGHVDRAVIDAIAAFVMETPAR